MTLEMINIIALAANINNVSPALLMAVCAVESDLRPGIINHDDGGSASYGLCQLKLRTARHVAGRKLRVTELLDAATNADLAAKYLREQLNRYEQDTDCAIAAYNAGACRLDSEGEIRNERYVKKVNNRYRRFKARYGDNHKPIYIRDRADSLTLFFRRHADHKTTHDVQGAASLVDTKGAQASVRSGDREQ